MTAGRHACILHPALPPLPSLGPSSPAGTASSVKRPVEARPPFQATRRTRLEGARRPSRVKSRRQSMEVSRHVLGERPITDGTAAEALKKRGHQASDSFDLGHVASKRAFATGPEHKKVTASLPTPSATSDASKREKRIERTREFTTELMKASEQDKLRRGLLDFGLDLCPEETDTNQVVEEDPAENPFLALSGPASKLPTAVPASQKESQEAKPSVDECPWRTGIPIRDEANNPFLESATSTQPTVKNAGRVLPGQVSYVFRGKKVIYEDPHAFLMADDRSVMEDGTRQFQPKRLFQDEKNVEEAHEKAARAPADDAPKRRRLS